MVVCIIILLAISIGALFWGLEEDNKPLIVYTLIIIIVIAVQMGLTASEPSALDVYQGKTTLQITYKDSIPVDSVVVYK